MKSLRKTHELNILCVREEKKFSVMIILVKKVYKPTVLVQSTRILAKNAPSLSVMLPISK